MGTDYPTLADRQRQSEAASQAVWQHVELPRMRHRRWLLEHEKDLETSVVVPPPGLQASFGLFEKSKGREAASASSKSVDALLDRHLGRRR